LTGPRNGADTGGTSRARLLLWLPCLALAASGCPSQSTASLGNGGGGSSRGSTHHAGGSSSGAASHGDAGSGSSSSTVDTGSSGGSASLGGSSSGGVSSSAAPVCGSDDADAGAPTLFDCLNIGDYSGDAGGCPADWFGSKTLDYSSCKPICGASVQAQSPAGVPIEGTAVLSDPIHGTFHFCLPAGVTFETVIAAPSYGTYYYGEIQGQLGTNVPIVGMLSASSLSAFGSFVPGGLDPTRGALAVPIDPQDECDFGPEQKAGYTVTLLNKDGGVFPDGGYELLYLSASGYPDPALTATSELGIAIFYDIDTSVTTFPLLKFGTPDGGACKIINAQLGFTGRIQVAPGAFSEEAIFVE
jgi:hypothetical protein